MRVVQMNSETGSRRAASAAVQTAAAAHLQVRTFAVEMNYFAIKKQLISNLYYICFSALPARLLLAAAPHFLVVQKRQSVQKLKCKKFGVAQRQPPLGRNARRRFIFSLFGKKFLEIASFAEFVGGEDEDLRGFQLLLRELRLQVPPQLLLAFAVRSRVLLPRPLNSLLINVFHQTRKLIYKKIPHANQVRVGAAGLKTQKNKSDARRCDLAAAELYVHPNARARLGLRKSWKARESSCSPNRLLLQFAFRQHNI